MPASKIKNLVIAVLLLANLVFLGIVISDDVSEKRETREVHEAMAALFSANGIVLSDTEFALDAQVYTPITERSTDAEARIAEVLLGNTVCTDHGGSIYNYVGDRGEAVFRSGGEFEVTLNEGSIRASGGAQRYTQNLLKDIGVSAEIMSVTENAGTVVVTAACTYAREHIFNCFLTFCFDQGDSLVSVSGQFPNVISNSDGTQTTVFCSTAMMEFFEAVKNGHVQCTQVYSVSMGYVMSVTPFGDGYLHPTWLVETDTGEYYIDAISCKMQTGME